jgi:hypothetical protein
MKKFGPFVGVCAAVVIFAVAVLFRQYSPGKLKISLPFEIQDVADSVGITHHYPTPKVRLRFNHLEAFVGGEWASLSVADYNNDGWMDIYTNADENRLFRNNGDGTFTDVAEEAGVANFKRPTIGGYFFDYNNDGFKDLFVLTMGEVGRILRNDGKGSFVDVTNQMNIAIDGNDPEMVDLLREMPAKVLTFLDFDNDGYLDFIVANKWNDAMPNNFNDANNGGHVFVFRNIKGKSFKYVRGRLGMNHVGFHRSIGIYDFRGTGRADVWFALDFSPDKLYLNEGGGRFRDASPNILTKNFSRNGMNTDTADLDNDGHPVIFVSHIFEPGYRPAGNTLWKWVEGDRFVEVSRRRGVNRCGWAWGGKFVDLDNDGHLDLMVGNGFISNNPKRNYWYNIAMLAGSDRSVTFDPSNWPPMNDASLAGYQQSCLYYNRGNGTFDNVVAATGMANDLSDERGIALIDFLNNGSQSLVVANQKGKLRLYKVTQKNQNQWIGFSLSGTKSNRDGFGAKMIVTLEDGQQYTRQLQTTNGYASQSDHRLHFGLGRKAKIKSVQLNWPSGTKQTFAGDKFGLNQYHSITESK